MHPILFLFVASLLSIPAFANEETHPRFGLISSSTEMSSINYSCSSPKSESGARKIECELSYETLKKGKYDLQKEAIEAEFKTKGIPQDMCTMFDGKNILDMSVSEINSAMNRKDSTLNSFNREVTTAMIPVLKRMCKEKTLESLNGFAELMAGIEANTCEIQSSKVKKLFVELTQAKGQRSVWISDGVPLTQCGKKEVIKFLPAADKRWHLHYENIILNKQAKDDAGKSCKEQDGIRNEFNSKNSTWVLPCKYIKITNTGAWRGPSNPN